MDAIDKLKNTLLILGKRIDSEPVNQLHHPKQKSLPEWRGADTRITSDFARKPGDMLEEHDLVVRTLHAKSLTWLFFELRDAFNPWLDASNKYGFFGALAQTAQQHLAQHQPESTDHRPLLKAVLATALRYWEFLRQEGAFPEDSRLIVHERDVEGQQRRIDLETGEETF